MPDADNLLDHPLIAQRYFFPRRDAPEDPFVVQSGDVMLNCHRHSPHPGARTVIHFHGNGEVVADYLPDVAGAFAELGLNVFFAEYRGYGGSTGEPLLGSMLSDVGPIFEAAGAPADQVIVFGRSVGSIFAIELADQQPDIDALVLESGIASPFERLALRVDAHELGATEDGLKSVIAARLDHQAKLERYRGRLLILHARNDQLVDLTHAERNHGWAGSDDKRLVVFDRGDHNSILPFNWSDYWAAVGAL